MSSLAGRRIVVTRPEAQADAMCERLRAAGAVAVRFPTIAIAPPLSFEPLDAALRTLHHYDWVVFTSANGARHVRDRASQLRLDPLAWRRVRVAAVGPATAGELRAAGIEPAAIPDEYLTERIADAVGDVRGHRFLLLRADMAGPGLPRRLRERGAIVEDVEAYRTLEQPPPVAARTLLEGADAVTFTSPSTVRGFARSVGAVWREAAPRAVVASIGPVTSGAARAIGIDIDVEAGVHTVDGLLAALATHFGDSTAREKFP